VDLHNTNTCKLRNIFDGNHFNQASELQAFLDGVSQQAEIRGAWHYRKDGDGSYTQVSVTNKTANVDYEADFSSNYSAYTDRPLGRVLCSVKLVNDNDTAGYIVFKPAGGDDDEDQYIRLHYDKSSLGTEYSWQVELPLNSDFKVTYNGTTQYDLQIRLHAHWG
jgi:hypothetical protein